MIIRKKIKMKHLKKIFNNKSSNIKVKVNSLDGYQPVIRYIDSGIKECLIFNDSLESSIDQKIEVRDKGWIRADKIILGDYFLKEDGYEVVFSIKNIGKKNVYTITVDHPNHRYLCNGISIKNCSDAMNTFGLFKYYASRPEEDNVFFNSSVPLTIDHRCTDVLRNLSRAGAPIDFDYYLYAMKDTILRIALLENEIFKYVGRKFDINSPDQVSKLLFEEYNIPLLAGEEKNKKGNYSTKEDVLDELFKLYPDYTILRYIVTYRKLVGTNKKFYMSSILNSYVDALLPYTRVQIQYSQTVAPTARFSSASNKGKTKIIAKTTKTGKITYSYFKGSWDCGFNSQAITNPHFILKKAKKIKKISSNAGINLNNPYPEEVIQSMVKRVAAA